MPEALRPATLPSYPTWNFSHLDWCATRSNEVAEHMTVIPVAVFLLMDPVETLGSLVGNSAVGATALESGGPA